MTPEIWTQLLTQFGIAGLIVACIWKAMAKMAEYTAPRIDKVVNAHVDLVTSLKDSEQSRTANEVKQTELMQTLSVNQQELIATHRQSIQRLSDDHKVIIGALGGKVIETGNE